MNTSNEIHDYLTRKKVNEKTEITMSLLRDMMHGYTNEQLLKLKGSIDRVEFCENCSSPMTTVSVCSNLRCSHSEA